MSEDNKKIFFVIQKTNEKRFSECISSLYQLKRVEGFSYEIVAWENGNGDSIQNIYNRLRVEQRGGYKLFFKDTMNFINENILQDIVCIFNKDEKIALIGIKGAKGLPESGIVDEADEIYGGYYCLDDTGQAVERKYKNTGTEYIEVESVSSEFVAVRDLYPCRKNSSNKIFGELLSNSFGLYGYRMVVPHNAHLWCFVAAKEDSLDEDEKSALRYEKRFFDVLKSTKKPFLTIGIPTYNRSKYLRKCLANLYDQIGDFKAVEVFVSNNDSPDDTEDVVSLYMKNQNFRYYRQPVNIVGKNFDFLWKNATGNFVIACGDDDYFNDGTVLRMLEAITLNPNAAVIGLAWNSPKEKIYKGEGMDDFLLTSARTCTSISSIVLNHQYYMELEKKEKYINLNQVYLQMEMIRNHPVFSYIYAANFKAGSGEAGYHPERLTPKEKQGDFCSVFIAEYYDILNQYINRGLSRKALSEEKVDNLNKFIFPWFDLMMRTKGALSWRIGDNVERVMRRYFGNEVFYPQLKEKLAWYMSNKCCENM